MKPQKQFKCWRIEGCKYHVSSFPQLSFKLSQLTQFGNSLKRKWDEKKIPTFFTFAIRTNKNKLFVACLFPADDSRVGYKMVKSFSWKLRWIIIRCLLSPSFLGKIVFQLLGRKWESERVHVRKVIEPIFYRIEVIWTRLNRLADKNLLL